RLGPYGAQLIVNDGNFDSAPDSVSVLASATTSVTEPAGDATIDSRVQVSPDLVSATVSTDGGTLTVEVRFAPGTFNPATSLAQFNLDIDQNPATGSPGVDSAQNERALMGVEFIVNIGANLGAQAEVRKFTGQSNSFNLVGTVPSVVLANGYRVSIPLTLLDNDDGRLNFKVTASALINPSGPGFTGVLDYIPNLGLPPGGVR